MNGLLKMLLIDDDQGVLLPLARLIGRAFEDRIELTVLSDPAAALLWIERNSPDLVVTDLEMPGIDGFAILECARSHNPSAQVVIHSGHVSEEALSRALTLEAARYVPKHVGFQALRGVLEHAYDHVIGEREDRFSVRCTI